MIKTFCAVFLGGGLGAGLRFLIGYFSTFCIKNNVYVVTFSINIVACFLMGCLCGIFLDKASVHPALKLALTVGFCGGFSTYTAFSVEMLEMLKTGQILTMMLYMLMTLVLGLLAVWGGMNFAKFL